MLNLYSNFLPMKFHEMGEMAGDRLADARLDEKFIKNFFNADTIDTTKLPYGKVITAIFALNKRIVEDFDDLVKFGLRLKKDGKTEEYLDGKFEYDHNLKAAFILETSHRHERILQADRVRATFLEIQKYEIEKGKSILDFNNEDMIGIVQHYRDKYVNYMTYRYYMIILSDFMRFCATRFRRVRYNYKESWDFKEVINTIPNSEKPNKFFTLDELIDIVGEEQSIQKAIVPILLFEGVKVSRTKEWNEIGNLKTKDVRGNAINIRGKYERVIDVDVRVQVLINHAINTDFYDNGLYEVELPTTGYVLRPTGSNKGHTGEALAESSIQKRIRDLKKEYDILIAGRQFNIKNIRNSGKIHYINKQLNKGYKLSDAIYLTMVRFGEIEDKNILKRSKNGTEMSQAYKLKMLYLSSKNKK